MWFPRWLVKRRNKKSLGSNAFWHSAYCLKQCDKYLMWSFYLLILLPLCCSTDVPYEYIFSRFSFQTYLFLPVNWSDRPPPSRFKVDLNKQNKLSLKSFNPTYYWSSTAFLHSWNWKFNCIKKMATVFADPAFNPEMVSESLRKAMKVSQLWRLFSNL